MSISSHSSDWIWSMPVRNCSRVTVPGETTIQGLASAFGEVWVLGLDGNGKLQALDPASGQLTGRPTTFQAGQAVNAVSGLAAGGVFTTDNQLYKLVGA